MKCNRIGRSKTMMIMLTMVVICGTLTSFSPSYGWFLAGIWACGFSAIGFGTVMYCWMMEILSGKEKTIFGVAPHLNFAFWGFAVAVIAYLVPDWQKMALIFSLPLIILYATYWILPESPRYLSMYLIGSKDNSLTRMGAFFLGFNNVKKRENYTIGNIH